MKYVRYTNTITAIHYNFGEVVASQLFSTMKFHW
uniref:Uncharacterized protein n=1 Tax=Arundo donax TaxID=35708 RepID=A0A0A9EKX0_ARUDO